MEDPLPGFRFYPTEEELVSFYLQNKLRGTRTDIDRVIPTVDIYDYNPWDLPDLAGDLCPEDSEQWFFFLLRQEREARGGRPNRLTTEGYWKATGSPGDVYSSRNNSVIGRKRTMVFYVGRAPNGSKTSWKMNEYKVIESPDQASSSSSAAPNPQIREELSLCRIYKRSRNLRSFDRRPPSELARGDQAAVNPQHHDNDAATAAAVDYQLYDRPMVPERGDWSLESSPGRHTAANPSPSGENENNPGTATADSEPWWDSDQFHWFDI